MYGEVLPQIYMWFLVYRSDDIWGETVKNLPFFDFDRLLIEVYTVAPYLIRLQIEHLYGK